ncbi:DUF4365 domain-containing protein [Pontibacter silvestris]|uniref:DUF4365 domain-containing protein n=1 Tax=Pontibacter silvestris TaxID=2305183 RepID=A0ABW4WUM8_9BACT|nr:DUF4365 domain-containing protein [Pontibacter silvestris]MCC9136998.1 DUF4365 domain-containing protein [Pontibacter silvestris]
MTLDLVKEHLSNNFIGILAAKRFCYLTKPPVDSGIDYTVNYNIARLKNGKTSYFTAPHQIDLQLKATTEKSISVVEDHIIYDLRAKNYDDLIDRRDNGFFPLILILFILPEDENEWVNCLEDQLVLCRSAYWFLPDSTYQATSNVGTNRIRIPLSNRLDIDFFDKKIKDWIPEWK